MDVLVRSTSIARALVAVAAVWHASALAPGAASPPAQLLAFVGVHSNVLARGGETAAPAAVGQEDTEERVVGPADGGARGSDQRQQPRDRQQARVKGTARASGIADAALATRSASAIGAQRWARQGFASSMSAEYPSPAVSPDGSTVFVGWGALNATTGAQRWAFATGDYVSSSPAVSPDGETVFVGSADKKVYALNATTGAQRWAFATWGAVRSSPAVSPDGSTVFVGSDDQKVYALKATTGAQRWAFATWDYVSSSPAVSPDGATVFVGSDDKKVYALNATTGAQRWAFATWGAVRSSPAVSPDGSTVFVGSDDQKVYALHAVNGTQRWAFATGGDVSSSPAVSPDGSTVFVGSRDSKVYALNATTGAQRWAFATGNNVDSSPAVSPDGSTVFVGSDDKKVYVLNATTGAHRWAFATGGAVRSSPAVSPDGATVFVSSHDAQVYALNSNPPCSPASSGPNRGSNGECLETAKVIAATRPPPTKECSLKDTLMAQLPTLFLCGLAYLGVKSMCSAISKTPETPGTMSSSAMTGFPTTTPTGLPNGWQACIDQAGNTYYQNRITQQTQWEHPARSAIHEGVHQRADVFGSSFGGLGLFDTIHNQYVIQASQALGTTNPVGPVQTPALTQELDADAATWEKAWAAFNFIKEISQRLIFIIPKLIKGGSNYELWLYVIDLALLGYFAFKQRYCPGCLYNNLHVLIKGKKLKPLLVSIKSRRFSGTKKLIVGVGAIATLVQVVESISEVYCFFTAETPWQQKSPGDIADTFWMAAGVLMNSLQSLVAVVAYVTFCCFGMVAYLRFYLSCLIACALCQAQSKLRTQQSRLERGVDQRHIFQRVGGVFSSHYSKDSVNQRNVENAEREVESLSSAGGKKCCGFSIPDLGSNAGTGMYKFWTLIWESLDDSLLGLIWNLIPTELQERITIIPQALYKRVCARAPAPEPQCEYNQNNNTQETQGELLRTRASLDTSEQTVVLSRPTNSGMGSQSDQVPMETKDIQVSSCKGRETERERERVR
jgi:outer membrane protein assembly factor BamB